MLPIIKAAASRSREKKHLPEGAKHNMLESVEVIRHGYEKQQRRGEETRSPFCLVC